MHKGLVGAAEFHEHHLIVNIQARFEIVPLTLRLGICCSIRCQLSTIIGWWNMEKISHEYE